MTTGSSPIRILVVDDDVKTVASINLYLEHQGYEVINAPDGRQALADAKRKKPDLIVLDLMLPEISGIEVCRRLRAESAVPIIMLTSRATEEDKLRGLDLGADDYMTKPFSPRELVARIRAVLRRSIGDAASTVEVDDLVIDLERHEVRLKDKQVTLTPTEFKLLETLARSPGRTFTRQQLLERAFGWDYDGFDRTIDAHIMNLRRKLDLNSRKTSLIATVFGVGYKFSGDRDDS